MSKFDRRDPDCSDYAPVADRIALFYQRYPTGRIITRLHSRTGSEVTFCAVVYRELTDPEPAATGWASEREGDGEINTIACLENTETSAVGRALANLGFTASTRRPSREEMEKAARARMRLGVRPTLVSEQPTGHRPVAGSTVPSKAMEEDSLEEDPLQQRANAVHDALDLLNRAEALGLSTNRSEVMRAWLMGNDPDASRLGRVERRLRHWITRRRAALG